MPSIPPPAKAFLGGETGQIIHPDYHNPYTEQLNLGYAFQINSGNSIEVDYIHTLGLREAKTYDINPKSVALDGGRVLDATFAKAGLPVLGAFLYMQSSFGRSRYDGLNVLYRRRLTRLLSLNASYVLSRALCYNGPAAAFYNPPMDNLHYLASTDFGPTPSDSTHRGVIGGIFNLPGGFRVSTMLQVESGGPTTRRRGSTCWAGRTRGRPRNPTEEPAG